MSDDWIKARRIAPISEEKISPLALAAGAVDKIEQGRVKHLIVGYIWDDDSIDWGWSAGMLPKELTHMYYRLGEKLRERDV